MHWGSMKIILASTATAAIASQIAIKLYKKLRQPKSHKEVEDDTCMKPVNNRDREINDVILFSEQITYHYVKTPQNKDIQLCESRELNCFKLIRYIKSANETLDVCMYLITSNEIAEHIIKLGEKHVLVRILVDNDMAYTSGSQIKRLEQYSEYSVLIHFKLYLISYINILLAIII